MMALYRMLAWKLCDFSGDLDQYCIETLYLRDFSGGRTPLSPSGSARMAGVRGPEVEMLVRPSRVQLLVEGGPYPLCENIILTKKRQDATPPTLT